MRAEAEALKTAAHGDWIVGRTGGGRTADAQGKTVTGQYRDDEIFWLRDERVARYGLQALPTLWRAVDLLVAELNESLPAKLRWELGGRTTPMLACYHPGSAGYAYHVDNPDRDGRVLTAIFYLNKGWRPTDGGCVRLHPSLLMPSPAASDDAGSPAAAQPQRHIGSTRLASQAPGARAPLVAMSVDQVAASVAEGLRNKLDAGIILRLVQKIKVEEIDGEVLDSIDEADMEQVLGLSTFGQRRKFSQLITRLSSGAGSESAAGADTEVETGSSTGATEQTSVTIDRSDAPVDVRPVDGRLVLFWSDRRTPHEVLPLSTDALKDRIAVTCWYYDAGERAKALASSGATAETLLSASPVSLLPSSQTVDAQQEDNAAAAAAVARNKKKNRKKKERRKMKKQDVDETVSSSDENSAPRSNPRAAATVHRSVKLAKRSLKASAAKADDVVITEELLSDRIAALLAKEGKDSFLAMTAPQFFELLQVRGNCFHTWW